MRIHVCSRVLAGRAGSLVAAAVLLPGMIHVASADGLRAHSRGLAASSTLQLGDRFPVTVDYSLTSTQQALIYARPVSVARGGSGANHHEPLPVSPGKGSFETWLSFDEPAQVLGIDLFMVDLRSGKILAREKLDVNVTWGTAEDFRLQKEHAAWLRTLWFARRDIEASSFTNAQQKFEQLLAGDTATLPRHLVLEAQMGLALTYDLQGQWQRARQQYDAVAWAVEHDGAASFPHEAMRQNAGLVILNQQFEISWKQGRLGECRAVIPSVARQADALQALISGLADGQWWNRLYAADLYAPWRSRYNVARLMASSGQRSQAIEVMSALAEDIHRDWCEHRMGRLNKGTAFDVLAALAEWYLEAGDVEKADALVGKDICFHYTNIERSFKALQELWRARIAALGGKAVDLKPMADAVARADEYGSMDHRMQARYSHVRLLIDLKDWAEAGARADDAITFARDHEFRLALVYLLTARVEIRLERGDLAGAEMDVREALALAREAAQKVAEPKLYFLFGRIKLAQGDLLEARRLFEAARDLARRFQQPWIEKACDTELDALPVIVGENTVPPGTGSVESAENAAAARVTATNVPERQPAMADIALSGDDHDVILFPSRVNTRVATNEFARARFCLVNPLGESKSGRLRVSGKVLPVSWSADVMRVTANLASAAGANSQPDLAMELPPLSTTEVYLQREPYAAAAPDAIELMWSNGSELHAVWETGTDVEDRNVAMVNVSRLVENPFYHVPFHHEMYYRGDGAAWVDLKVHASVPCRAELYDADQGLPLAVDANGNGSFADVGDAVYVDGNEDGWPDLAFAPSSDVHAVFLWVYPLTKGAEPVEIAVSLGDGEQWTLQGVDVLSPLKEGPP